MPKAIKSRSSSLRIIGGQWRGRKLEFPALEGLRPTGDRIRETVFNWLQGELDGARCLDLFAGSGALGFEAVSRGGASALLVEYDTTAAAQLLRHCHTLGTQAVQVKNGNALEFLRQSSHGQYDVVFIDPPFAANLWQPTLELLAAGHWLAPGAWIYVESPPQQVLQLPTDWITHRQKQTGQVVYSLYRQQAEA